MQLCGKMETTGRNNHARKLVECGLVAANVIDTRSMLSLD